MMTEKKELYTAKRDSGLDVSAVSAPWSEARSKESSGAWLLVGFDDAVKDKVVLRAQGEGGLAGLRGHLAAEPAAASQILFGAFPFSLSDGQRRWSFVTWVGPSVSALKKGKVALQKQGVYNAFEGVHADAGIVGGGVADMEDAAVAATLKKALGKGDVSF